MRESTFLKCVRALSYVVRDNLTYREACTKTGLSASAFKRFRESQHGKDFHKQFMDEQIDKIVEE